MDRPLLLDVLQRRLDAVKADGRTISHTPVTYKAASEGCDWEGWLRTVFALRGRPIMHILPPLVLVTAVAALSVPFSDFFAGVEVMRNPYAMLITPVSFLLVFRLNRAAVRFYDGRSTIGKLIEVSRTLAGQAVIYCAHDSVAREDLCRWIVAYPVVSRNHFRGEPPNAQEFKGVLSEKEILELKGAQVQPLVALDHMRIAVLQATRTNCTDSAVVAAAMLQAMEESISVLNGAMGAAERINNTPLPFAYVAHLRTILILYLLGLPFILAASLRWATPVVTFLIAFSLLGVEAASVACERPFGLGLNHIPLDAFCDHIAGNVYDILRRHGGASVFISSSQAQKVEAPALLPISPISFGQKSCCFDGFT